MTGEEAQQRRKARPANALRQAIEADLAQVRAVTDPAPLPAPVLKLPLPPREAEGVDDSRGGTAPPPAEQAPPAMDLAPMLEAWMSPLVGEVTRLRMEVAELRAGERNAARERRTDLAKLLAGILVCFALVAAALVLVLKG